MKLMVHLHHHLKLCTIGCTVETVDSIRRTSFEEGEDDKIGRQDDGNGFLRCEQNHLY